MAFAVVLEIFTNLGGAVAKVENVSALFQAVWIELWMTLEQLRGSTLPKVYSTPWEPKGKHLVARDGMADP